MAGRGSSPPLFELLGRKSPDQPAQPAERAPKPKPEPRIKPVSRPAPAVERVRAVGSASIAGGSVSLPVSYVYIGLAGIALALILVWAIAFKMGGNATEQKLADGMARSLPPVSVDPLNEPSNPIVEPPPPTTRQTPVSRPTQQPEPRRADPGPAQPATTAVLTSSGAVAADPREPGLNYLVLESNMDPGEAERVVAFLGSNGQDSIAVPRLDQDGRPTNNPPRYRIVLTRGFPGSGFSESASTRESIVSEVRRLGTTWQQEFKGSTRFSSPQWTKYTP